MARKKRDDLSEVSKSLTASCVKSIRSFQHHSVKIDKLLTSHLKDASENSSLLKPGMVQSLMLSAAIAMDKQIVAQKAIQDLSMTASDTVEATMIIIEEDVETHERRVVGVPPELVGVVPLG